MFYMQLLTLQIVHGWNKIVCLHPNNLICDDKLPNKLLMLLIT